MLKAKNLIAHMLWNVTCEYGQKNHTWMLRPKFIYLANNFYGATTVCLLCPVSCTVSNADQHLRGRKHMELVSSLATVLIS